MNTSEILSKIPFCYQSLNINGAFITVNQYWLDTLEYDENEIIGKSFETILTKKSAQLFRNRFKYFKKNTSVNNVEFELIKKSGDIITVRYNGRIELDEKQEFVRTHCVFIDVTEEKLKEKELKGLPNYIETIREEERTLLAREIHDELGQALTALQMDISFLTSRFKENDYEKLLEKTKKMSELLADTISQVKKISTRLRPGVLDHLGLDAAIEWQAQEFEERSQIKCNIDLNLNGRQIDKKKSTAMFRIFQEALTNILRHSQATEVDIKLGINDDLIELSISDNGIGILDNQIENKKSFGLIGMRERAESLKGSLKIKTKRLEGTQVLVYLPLSN